MSKYSNSIEIKIQKIEEFIKGDRIIYDYKRWKDHIVQELKQEKSNASNALAKLILELLDCRNPKLDVILNISGEMKPTTELIESVKKTVTARGIKTKPELMRFCSEIESSEKIGWTGGTKSSIKRVANRVLATLTRTKADELIPTPVASEVACVHCGKPVTGEHSDINDLYDWRIHTYYARCDDCADEEYDVDTDKKLERIRSYPEQQRKKASRAK